MANKFEKKFEDQNRDIRNKPRITDRGGISSQMKPVTPYRQVSILVKSHIATKVTLPRKICKRPELIKSLSIFKR